MALHPAPVIEAATVRLRPPLKWAGGKRWLTPRLEALWRTRPGLRLVEPFCGGLAVALALDPARALLNDVNPHPVNFYRHLQGGLRIRVPMRNDRDLYYRHRSDFNRLAATRRGLGSRRAAELFYYLNRTAYNGLCRFNRKGEFNVPFGRHERINYVRDFAPYRSVLSRWEFSSEDFESLALGDDDFIYADPPYDVPFRQYSRHGFDWDEQERLARWLADTRDRWWHRTRRRSESWICTPAWGSTSPWWMRPAASAAPAIGRRRAKCWRPGDSTDRGTGAPGASHRIMSITRRIFLGTAASALTLPAAVASGVLTRTPRQSTAPSIPSSCRWTRTTISPGSPGAPTSPGVSSRTSRDACSTMAAARSAGRWWRSGSAMPGGAITTPGTAGCARRRELPGLWPHVVPRRRRLPLPHHPPGALPRPRAPHPLRHPSTRRGAAGDLRCTWRASPPTMGMYCCAASRMQPRARVSWSRSSRPAQPECSPGPSTSCSPPTGAPRARRRTSNGDLRPFVESV